jgi:hypothetical protein
MKVQVLGSFELIEYWNQAIMCIHREWIVRQTGQLGHRLHQLCFPQQWIVLMLLLDVGQLGEAVYLDPHQLLKERLS